MTSWLVTGGAGYIGAHVVRAFQAEGITPVVLDNFSTGLRQFVPAGVACVAGDIRDQELVTNTLIDHDCVGVMHIAGFKYAGVSVREPLAAYSNNVTGIASVLAAMDQAGVQSLVFSSSSSVYGTPAVETVTEDAPNHPESPYGESKLIGELLVRDLMRARPGFVGVNLRYFNVVGSGTNEVYDISPHNLFPLVCDALAHQRTPKIFGDDYDTPDGTCVRDYVHVADLAVSHVAAAKALGQGKPLLPAYNLGSGDGLSVRQIMDAFAAATGIDFTPQVSPRRPGDPARIVADGTAAAADLDWKMRHSVADMVSSAWEAWKAAGFPTL
ncbi:MAG: UDP-glucose 4-epimerase GalE [Propionibacteriaceae bacterium]|jgi:UDP-glucose 4-epimerase|nr:UDP-glucose 4-epimerase GalE [Propionibacteriaceae bacterium]